MTEPANCVKPIGATSHTTHVACGDEGPVNHRGLFVLANTHLRAIASEIDVCCAFWAVRVAVHAHLPCDVSEESHWTRFNALHSSIDCQLEVSREARVACEVHIALSTALVRTVRAVASRWVVHLGHVTRVRYALVRIICISNQNIPTNASRTQSCLITGITVESAWEGN